jgi:hypothetical protein
MAGSWWNGEIRRVAMMRMNDDGIAPACLLAINHLEKKILSC